MPGRKYASVLRRWQRPVPSPQPLLPPPARPVAIALLAACVATTAVLGALFGGQTTAGRFDQRLDASIQASFRSDHATLNVIAWFGSPTAMFVLSATLLAACLAAGRWRGAVLAAVSPAAASVITEWMLKPLIDRRLHGYLSMPSGHTTSVFALATVLAVLLVNPAKPRVATARSRIVRLLVWVAAFAAAGSVGVAMVGLGAHYVTDTVSGAAVGAATVLATALVIDLVGSRTAASGGLSSGSGRAPADTTTGDQRYSRDHTTAPWASDVHARTISSTRTTPITASRSLRSA